MKMFEVEVKSEGDLIILKQENECGKDVIVLHRDQIPLVSRWMQNEYCSHENNSIPLPE